MYAHLAFQAALAEFRRLFPDIGLHVTEANVDDKTIAYKLYVFASNDQDVDYPYNSTFFITSFVSLCLFRLLCFWTLFLWLRFIFFSGTRWHPLRIRSHRAVDITIAPRSGLTARRLPGRAP